MRGKGKIMSIIKTTIGATEANRHKEKEKGRPPSVPTPIRIPKGVVKPFHLRRPSCPSAISAGPLSRQIEGLGQLPNPDKTPSSNSRGLATRLSPFRGCRAPQVCPRPLSLQAKGLGQLPNPVKGCSNPHCPFQGVQQPPFHHSWAVEPSCTCSTPSGL